MHDIAEFLRRHPPFDALDDAALERVSDAVHIEYFPAGAVVLEQEDAGGSGYVIRTGAVDLVEDDRVVDHREVGDVFGVASTLTGAPTKLRVSAHDDLLVYRFPASVLAPPPTGASGATAATGSVGPMVRSILRPAVVLDPDDRVRDAVLRMGEAGVSAVLVRQRDGGLGIVTDRDLRSRVLAVHGRGPETPLREVMSQDAVSTGAGTPTDEALLLMLEHAVRHLPVVARDGRVLGLVEDVDLLAAEGHAPFRLRRAVTTAADLEDLVDLARRLPQSLVSADAAGVAPLRVMATRSIIVEAMIRRLLDLAVQASGPAPAPFAWLVLGSTGRRESFPSSDADSALVWDANEEDGATGAWMEDLARRVVGALADCGVPSDEHGVVAADPRFARSRSQWRRSVARWLADPTATDAVTYVSALVDGRVVTGAGAGPDRMLGEAMSATARDEAMVRALGRQALVHRPPTGFVRELVVQHTGENRGRLDLKLHGMTPVVDLARYGSVAARSTAVDTPQRLRDAAAAGVLRDADATMLDEVFTDVAGLRLQRQLEAIRAGQEPDDLIDPRTLSPFARRHLRDGFRAVAQVQHWLQGVLALGG
ncbi:MAG: putative nucleotidyltransferase substrate binding domain-containing protein [Actinomycetes bacterium]